MNIKTDLFSTDLQYLLMQQTDVCTHIYIFRPPDTYFARRTAHSNMMTTSPAPQVTDATLVMSSARVGGQLIHLHAAVQRSGGLGVGEGV